VSSAFVRYCPARSMFNVGVKARVVEKIAMLGQHQRRGVNKLSTRKAASIVSPGRHSDGGGLYLVVDKSGARRWVFMFRWRRPGETGTGKLREMGLGSGGAVPLARAREKAADARAMVADRIDPIAARHARVVVPTFGAMADEVIETRTEGMRGAKSKARWKRALENYAEPIRALGVDIVGTEDVLKVLKPIWSTKPESAQKARGYIEAVLDAARAKGFRHGDNPARWRGHLDHLLAKPQKLSRGHHAAMAYADLPAFVTVLRGRGGNAAVALEFLILTAARTGEARGATWDEVDMKASLWTVPAARMKAGVEHRVPLCARAVEILTELAAVKTGRHVFAGQKAPVGDDNEPLSSMAMSMLLRRMKVDVTTHGFRSTFRDWAGEVSPFPRELAEAALAHTVGDDTERAYRRGDALEKRRKLMEAWDTFVAHGSPEAGNVSPFKSAVA
jgi:integrase